MSAEAPRRLRAPSRGHPRNLVVLRAGDRSLHGEWARGGPRDFDVFISYFGDTPDRYCDDADFHEARRGAKWPALAALVAERAAWFDEYDAVWFPDDDLAASTATVERMFAFFHANALCLAQPALTRNSFFTWTTLLQHPDSQLRFTRFVEVMAPIFSRPALRLCAPTFAESPSGWGLDWVWPHLCEQAGLGRIAVLDATPVWHTRPVGGELYRNHPALDPRADAERVLRRYGLREVRAIAKYSFQGRVAETPLPAWERLLFWMKRLNGRRKHALRS
jgi:hypothetical protein